MTPWPATLEGLDPDKRLDLIQAQISERIKDFEPTALIDLLLALGYPLEMLEFRSFASLTPRPTVFEKIHFPERYGDLEDELRVTIFVNLGLLSCRSPLPSYLMGLARRSENADPVIALLDTLDRSLLHERLRCGRAERTLRGWPKTERDFLRSANLNSPLGLQWLCEQVFPELGVLARRTDNEREVSTIGARLDGVSKLGECSFGSRARIGVQELELILICEDSRYDATRPWILVGAERLRDYVLPLLDEVCVTLTVSFVLLDRGTRAQLGSPPPSYIGYDLMLGDEQWRERSDQPPDPPARVRVYHGDLPTAEPDTNELERVLAEDTPARLELSVASTEPPPGAIGRSLALCLTHVGLGRDYRFDVVVDWGVRAWYRDEPRTISLSFVEEQAQGALTPKPPVCATDHPRLWVLLRDEARHSLGRQMTELILGGRPVTRALIQRLRGARDHEGLHALALTEVVPNAAWDADAWTEFSAALS